MMQWVGHFDDCGIYDVMGGAVMAKYYTVWRNLSICFETSNISMVTCYLQDLTSPWIHIWYLMHFRNVCVEYMGFCIFKDVF